MNVTLVRKVGHKLFDGRTNVNSTPGMTTDTSIARPMGRKLVRALKIFASALIVYAYATFVVLFDKITSAGRTGKVGLARVTLGGRVNGVKAVCITITVLFFTCDDVLKGCCCNRTGMHCVARQG